MIPIYKHRLDFIQGNLVVKYRMKSLELSM